MSGVTKNVEIVFNNQDPSGKNITDDTRETSYIKQTNMKNEFSRRKFLQTAAISATAIMLPRICPVSVSEKMPEECN